MRPQLVATAVSAVILLATAGPASASAEVTTVQMREHGAAVNFTNIPEYLSDEPVETPPGTYYFITVSAGVGEASGHNYAGSSKDTAWITYTEWTVNRKGAWELVTDWAGFAPDGAQGLDMSNSAAWATLDASIPVGYCSEYASEDQGGNCLDYVQVGTARVDLAWRATTDLMSDAWTESWGVPGEWQYTARHTGHYREAAVTGTLTLPGSMPQGVVSEGTIYLRALGTMDLSITCGR
jgi:hypothetical protein